MSELETCMDGMGVTFKLASLDEFDVSDLKQSISLGLINKSFSGIVFFGCGSNYMYCDVVGIFLQSVFRPCHLGCGSNRLWLENSLGVSSIFIYILASLWVYYLMSWYCTSVSDFWKVQLPYFLAPDITSCVVHVFILVKRGGL